MALGLRYNLTRNAGRDSHHGKSYSMKVIIEVDCTPDEARQFLGLPDLKPMQAAVMARMGEKMAEAADRLTPDAVLRSWLSLVPQTPEQLKDMIGRFFRPPAGGDASQAGD